MKILYLRTRHELKLKAGGSVGHTSGVINALRKLADLDVVSNADLPGVVGEVRIIKPFVMGILPAAIKEIAGNFKFIYFLRKAVCDYSAIYQRYAGFSFVGAYFAKKYGISLILEFNSSEIWKLEHWDNEKRPYLILLLKKLYTFFIRRPFITRNEPLALKYACLIIVVSQVLKDNLVRQGITPDKILVNPNGVDADKFFSDESDTMIREQYGLQEKIVVGFIGTFGQWHGVIEMAEAIGLLFERNVDLREKVHFLLVGDGILRKEAETVIQNGSYAANVTFTGLVAQEEAVRYLNACDIFLSPHIPNSDGSKFFGSPTKLFEYMAMGKGIVASALDQIADILEHKKTAYLVKPGDISELAMGVETLIRDESLRNTLGNNARQEVLSSYTWDKHVQKILTKLKDMREII